MTSVSVVDGQTHVKEAIVEESRQTMAHLQVYSLREPDIADRASSETDWSIELRTCFAAGSSIDALQACIAPT